MPKSGGLCPCADCRATPTWEPRTDAGQPAVAWDAPQRRSPERDGAGDAPGPRMTPSTLDGMIGAIHADREGAVEGPTVGGRTAGV